MEKKYWAIFAVVVLAIISAGVFGFFKVSNDLFVSSGNNNGSYSLDVSVQVSNNEGMAGSGVNALVWTGDKDDFKCFVSSTQSTSVCSKKYPAGSVVYLYDNVYDGGEFKGWTPGSCDQISEIEGHNVCAIELNSDRKIGAVFEEII